MSFFLLRMKVSGIKNISQDIQIDFYNKIVNSPFNCSNSHIKAIYGANGAGKTALIYSMEIYRNLVLAIDYLAACNATNYLDGVINQISKRFSIEVTFAVIDEEKTVKGIYRHGLILKCEKNRYYIAEEKLEKLSGSQLNKENKYKIIYKTENGKITDLFKGCKNTEYVTQKTINLLTKQSLLCAFEAIPKEEIRVNIDKSLAESLAILGYFTSSIIVCLQGIDKNQIDLDYLYNQFSEIQEQETKIGDEKLFNLALGTNSFTSKQSIRVSKSSIDNFLKYVNNLCAFLKIFKTDLTTIEIKKDENDGFYECEMILVYDDGKRINSKYECTGIKKLIELYSALCGAEHKKIVFIDDFDANIHDVVLLNLIEYLKNYTEGQLIFTTHNLSPMKVLQKEKHSIDFLSTDSKITSWKSNGNYDAANLYREGLIENSPFNIEPFNFLGVFEINHEDTCIKR